MCWRSAPLAALEERLDDRLLPPFVYRLQREPKETTLESGRKMGRYTVCLYFQDLERGEFRTIYPQGLSTAAIMALLADPAAQFAPVPPPPPPPPVSATQKAD